MNNRMADPIIIDMGIVALTGALATIGGAAENIAGAAEILQVIVIALLI